MQVLEKEPGHPEALDRLADLLQAQYRAWATAEMEAQAALGEAAFGEKKWFDAISQWSLVRELVPEHPKAAQRISEAGAQLKAGGIPGLPPAAQAPWTAQLLQSYEKGLAALMNGHELGCINEWRTGLARAPQARDLLEAYGRKVEELHGAHMRYHVDRAKKLWEAGDTGHSMAQLRHALQLDPQAGDVRALYDAQKPHADQSAQQYLRDAEQWEKSGRLNAAVFCLERALEIDPNRDGLRNRVSEGRTRLARLRQTLAAMDGKRT
jgi:tetratricopeptide (TPR) repeat protein